MACIEHYIKDAENVFDDIEFREKAAQRNAYLDYKAARTIQRWFRGYKTRKHIKHLNNCATMIQRFWRGHVVRKLYYQLLQGAVHKMYWEHYNQMATKIQKVWRGHFVRSRIFSYYKLKTYINDILQKNKELLHRAKKYEEETEKERQKRMQQECREWLTFMSFKIHHLIRTRQIEGVYSKHGTLEYSAIEKHLKNLKFVDYMNSKHENEKLKQLQTPHHDYMFKGRMRECEDAWLHRNDPGMFSLATGEYEADMREHKKKQQMKDSLSRLQSKPMVFDSVRYNDTESKLNTTKFECPPLHQTKRTTQA